MPKHCRPIPFNRFALGLPLAASLLCVPLAQAQTSAPLIATATSYCYGPPSATTPEALPTVWKLAPCGMPPVMNLPTTGTPPGTGVVVHPQPTGPLCAMEVDAALLEIIRDLLESPDPAPAVPPVPTVPPVTAVPPAAQ